MPKRHKTGGRQRGTPNRSTVDGRTRAQQYAAEATGRLVHWMRSDDPRASIPATQEILARAYGRPSQEVDLKLPPPAAPTGPVILSDDPSLAAAEYASLMAGVPWTPRASTSAAPAAAPSPPALAAPARCADVPAVDVAPPVIAARVTAEAAAAPPLHEAAPAAVPHAPRAQREQPIIDATPKTEGGAVVWQAPQTEEDIANELLKVEAARATANRAKREAFEEQLEVANAKERAALAERQRRQDEEDRRMGGE
jgi:hypothetical protein